MSVQQSVDIPYSKTFEVELSRMDCCSLQMHKQAKLEMQFVNKRLGNTSWSHRCVSSGSLLVQYSDVAFPAPRKVRYSKRLKKMSQGTPDECQNWFNQVSSDAHPPAESSHRKIFSRNLTLPCLHSTYLPSATL